MQQFRQIHVTNKRNPCIDSDKYMWQLWQSKIQNEEGVNDLIKTLWFCCICFYSLLYSTLFRSKRPKIRIWDHEWRWQAWPQMMTAILGPSSHHLCSHLSLSFANLGVNFQLLGCHSLILTIKMIASYMYQNVGVRGVKRHIILSDRNPLNTTVFNGSMEDNNPSDEVLSNLQISRSKCLITNFNGWLTFGT